MIISPKQGYYGDTFGYINPGSDSEIAIAPYTEYFDIEYDSGSEELLRTIISLSNKDYERDIIYIPKDIYFSKNIHVYFSVKDKVKPRYSLNFEKVSFSIKVDPDIE